MALQGISQANLVLGIFQEKNLTVRFYTYGSSGYSVVATNASSQRRSGVALLYWPSTLYVVEAIQKFKSNLIGFNLTKGGR